MKMKIRQFMQSDGNIAFIPRKGVVKGEINHPLFRNFTSFFHFTSSEW